MSFEKVLIIAEAGVNHNGLLENAIKLIDVAAAAGADIVKFQTFKANKLATESAPMAAYQQANIGLEDSQQNMLKKLELKYEHHQLLVDHCNKRNIRFLSTAFDFESLDFLKTLKMGLWKIPSGEITNLPYLEKIALTKDPVIISTGMSELQEVRAAIEVLLKNGTEKEKLTILHCNTDYPTKMEDVNLRAMQTMGAEFGVKFGYSDHTLGIEIPIAAVAMGATVIEKHFTLDRKMEGPDHAASLEPQELKEMVAAIRNIQKALGQPNKIPSESELANRAIARKSIVAAKKIHKGDLLTVDNLTTSRPGTGISPMKWYQLIGTQAQKEYLPGELI